MPSCNIHARRPLGVRGKRRAFVEALRNAEGDSAFAVVGCNTPEIFDVLEETPPGKAGEIQITDGLGLLLKRQPMFALQFEGRRYDTGRPLGMIKASIELALARDDVGPGLREYLRSLDLDS